MDVFNGAAKEGGFEDVVGNLRRFFVAGGLVMEKGEVYVAL